MTGHLRLPLRAVTGQSGDSTLLIDQTGFAIGGFYGERHEDLAKDACAAINARGDLASLLRQVRREWAATLKLSGETIVAIDRALAGRPAPSAVPGTFTVIDGGMPQ